MALNLELNKNKLYKTLRARYTNDFSQNIQDYYDLKIFLEYFEIIFEIFYK